MSQRGAPSTAVSSTPNHPPVQQNAAAIGGTAVYHLAQLPPDSYAQQPPMYGFYGPPEEMYGTAPNSFAQIPYGYANLPAQTEYPLTAIPPPLASQQGNPTANFSPQPHTQLGHSAGGPHRQQMIAHPQFPTQPPPNGPPPSRIQHFQAGFPNNAALYPQVQSAQPSSSSVSNPAPVQQQGDQRSKLPPLYDNSTDYTASWVSSTSSIPPDMKVPPDHNSGHNSPIGGNEYAHWGQDGMNAMPANRQAPPNRVYAQGCGPPNSQMNWQNPGGQPGGHMIQPNAPPMDMSGGHMYGAYETNGGNGFVHSSFMVQPADQMSAPPPQQPPHYQQHPMKNRRAAGGNGAHDSQHQFVGNGNSNAAKMSAPPPPPFMFNNQHPPFLPPNAAFMPPMFAGGGFQYQPYMLPAGIRMPNYYPPNYQPFFQPFQMQMPINPLFPVDARPLSPQLERFHNTWLDQDLPPMEQLAVEQSLMPMALAHNAAQFNRANRGHFGNGPSGPNGRHSQSNSLLTATQGIRTHFNGGGGKRFDRYRKSEGGGNSGRNSGRS